MGGVKGYPIFLQKVPFFEMRDLFIELQEEYSKGNDEINFFYVSAAPFFTFDGDEWIQKNRFPIGPVILKTLQNKGPTYQYKYQNIKNIILSEQLKNPITEIIFFGDNSQYDANVYYDLNRDLNLNASIFIRDVSTEATYFSPELEVKKLEGVHYFFSERELLEMNELHFMSETLKERIKSGYLSKKIIPKYVLTTLKDRLKDQCEAEFKDEFKAENPTKEEIEILSKYCKQKAQKISLDHWNEYFKRFN